MHARCCWFSDREGDTTSVPFCLSLNCRSNLAKRVDTRLKEKSSTILRRERSLVARMDRILKSAWGWVLSTD